MLPLDLGSLLSLVSSGLFYALSLATHQRALQLEAVKPVELSELPECDGKNETVAVHGHAWSQEPLEAITTEMRTHVVISQVEQLTKFRIRERGQWSDTKQESIGKKTRAANWAVDDTSGRRLPVVQCERAESISLQPAGDKTIPNIFYYRDMLAAFGGKLNEGLRQVERVLPLGASLTVVGSLSKVPAYSLHMEGAVTVDGMAFIIGPSKTGGPFIISLSTLPELIAETRGISSICRTAACGCALLSAGLITIRAVRALQAISRRRKLRRQIRRARAMHSVRPAAAGEGHQQGPDPLTGNSGHAEQQQTDESSDDRCCVICLERPRCMAFTECGHQCLCEGCAAAVDQCPLCRKGGRCIRIYSS